MKAFQGLLVKETKLMKTWFVWGILLSILGAVAGYSLSRYVDDTIVFEVIVLMILSAHAFYLPVYLLLSLNIEAKTQLWLHNPNSGFLLFFSKFLTGFVFLIFSILIPLIIAIWTMKSHAGIYFFSEDQLQTILLLGVAASIIVSSIFLGIWTFFYWSLYHSLKSIGWRSGMRWGILIGLSGVLFFIENTLKDLPFYQSFWDYGAIDLRSFQAFNFELSKHSFSAEITANPFISLTEIALYLLILIVIVAFSIWMLEKKVEV